MKKYRNIVFIGLVASFLFAGISAHAEKKTIAVVDVINSYYKEKDKFYGDTTTFRNSVAALIALKLTEIEDLQVQDYLEVREKAAKYMGGDKDSLTVSLDKENALLFANQEGYDYMVLADVIEGKVSRKGGFTVFEKVKVISDVLVEVKIFDVKTGEEIITQKYKGQGKKGVKIGLSALIIPGTGAPKIDKPQIDPVLFGESPLGIPFVLICDQINSDLASKLGLILKKTADESK